MRCHNLAATQLLRLVIPLVTGILLSSKISAQPSVLEQISLVENGLEPYIQYSNEPTPTYNLEERLDQLDVPGVSIAIGYMGELLWAKGYGYSEISSQTLVTPETRFITGSVAKPVSALGILTLIESGVLDLDTNVNEYLSSWKVPENEYTQNEKVTLRNLLNHSSGLNNWDIPFEGFLIEDDIPSLSDILAGNGPLEAARVIRVPGEETEYSNNGYAVAQLVIEETTQNTFADFMEESVLHPLTMENSTYQTPLPENLYPNSAVGYEVVSDVLVEVKGKHPIFQEVAAAGFWTTPTDLVAFLNHVQSSYQNSSDGLITYEMLTSYLPPGPLQYGLGFTGGRDYFWFSGMVQGFSAEVFAWKDTPYTVAIMTNKELETDITSEILLSLAKVYDLPGINPVVRD